MQWAWRVYEGTGLPGGAFGSLIAGFGGITDLAGTLVGSPSLFGGIVDNAVSGAISQATGGLLDGSILSDPIGAATGAAADFASGQTSGLSDIVLDNL